MIVLEDMLQQPESFQEELLNYLREKKLESNENNKIIFWTEKIKLGKLSQFLKKKAKTEEFKLLQPYKLREWIKRYAREQGSEIENQAIEKLIDYIGSDLWRMSNEINKLISYKTQIAKGKGLIENEDIEILVKPKIDINIFNIIDALGQKNKKQALKLVHNYFKKGESWEYLLNRFIYQFRNLIKVKTGGGKDLHPFVFRKTDRQADNFTFQDLKKAYRELLEIDINIKKGKIEPRTALEMFIVVY